MRRFPTLAFLLIATISTLLAASDLPKITPRYYLNIYTGETKKGRPDDVIPIYTVEQLDSGVRVTYEFKWYRDDTITTKGKSHIFYLPNFYQTTGDGTPNVPDIPEKVNKYKVPYPHEATVTLDTYEYKEYTYELAPCAVTRWYPESYSGPIGRMTIKTEGFYPETPISKIPTDEEPPFIAEEFIRVVVNPMAYNHQTKTVRFTSKLVYTIHYNSQLQTTANKPIKIASAFREQSNEKDVPGDYLILTTSKCRGAISDFAEWKKAFGYNVYIESSDAWDVKSIKNKVADYFKKYKKNFQYLLLVGSHDDIPGEARVFKFLEEGKKDTTIINYVTDLYYGFNYSALDTLSSVNYWLYPTIDVGRIPAQNLYQAKVAFDKIIAYERCHNYTEGMFSKSLHCVQFEDETKPPTDSISDPEGIDAVESIRSFVRTSESVIDATRTAGISPTRVYHCWTLGRIRPEFYCDETPLPDELLSPSFNWQGNANDIQNELENGVGYVLDRGHGSPDRWQWPRYTTEHIQKERRALWEPEADGIFNMLADTITQTVHPVVFSITCLTGAFNKQPDSFAATSLCKKEGGSSAIIAASEISFSSLNNPLTLGLFDSMFPNTIRGLDISKAIQGEHQITQLGTLLDRGLILMEQYGRSTYKEFDITPFCRYQREIYHCFGDPSMKIRTNEQTKFENADIDMDYKTLTCRVKTGEGPAFISFYDANNGKIECVYSDEAEFTFSNVHSLGGVVTPGKQPPLIYKENVVISGPNKIPTIRSSWARTGAIPDPVLPEIDPKFENVKLNGETLTVTHNCGDNDRVIIYIADVKTASEVMKVECDSGSQSIDIDFSGVPSGIYAIMLIVNDNVADTVKISK